MFSRVSVDSCFIFTTLSFLLSLQQTISQSTSDISFGFHTPTPSDDEASTHLPSNITMTLFWESSKYQCSIHPDSTHENYTCTTANTAQTHICITDEKYWHSLEIDVESPEENTSIAIDEIFIHQKSEDHVVHIFCDEEEVSGCYTTLSIKNHYHVLFTIEDYIAGKIENEAEYAKYVNLDEVEKCDEYIDSSTLSPFPSSTISPVVDEAVIVGDSGNGKDTMNVLIVWIIIFVVCCIIPTIIGCAICSSLRKREALVKGKKS